MNLYRANFTGSMPNVNVEEGTITIRYPQRLWLLARGQRMAEIELSTAIPWQIVIRSGGSEVTTELGGLDLLELDANGAGSMFRVELPEPTRLGSHPAGWQWVRIHRPAPAGRRSPSPPERLGFWGCLR
jgi:hypothetical protein